MRSRSVSRRSAPSSSALDGSLSRMRSRSAHREGDRHNWVSQAAILCSCNSVRFRAAIRGLASNPLLQIIVIMLTVCHTALQRQGGKFVCV